MCKRTRTLTSYPVTVYLNQQQNQGILIVHNQAISALYKTGYFCHMTKNDKSIIHVKE